MFLAVPVLLVLAWAERSSYAYSQIELPKTFPPIQSTFMYDRNGSLLASIHGAVDRTIIPFDQMPESLRDAVIAVEDHGFYQHPGIDPVGILRAAWTDLVKHETVQGGSTITQQLVKQVYAGSYVDQPDGTTRLRGAAANDQGEDPRGAPGDQARADAARRTRSWPATSTPSTWGTARTASRRRRRRTGAIDAADLTVKQSATLAGLITSPSRFDPIDHP